MTPPELRAAADRTRGHTRPLYEELVPYAVGAPLIAVLWQAWPGMRRLVGLRGLEPLTSSLSGCRIGYSGSGSSAVTCGASDLALRDFPALTPRCHRRSRRFPE